MTKFSGKYPSKNDLSKIIVSSSDRDIGAVYFGSPSSFDESGELFVNVGNNVYEIPTAFLNHPQSWTDVVDPGDAEYTDRKEYFSKFFTEEGEIWNVIYQYRNDTGDDGYRDIVRLRIKYNGKSGQNLFELLYKIYTIKIYIYNYIDDTIKVKSFENDLLAIFEALLAIEELNIFIYDNDAAELDDNSDIGTAAIQAFDNLQSLTFEHLLESEYDTYLTVIDLRSMYLIDPSGFEYYTNKEHLLEQELELEPLDNLI